jgi:hypothetical protein
MTLREGTHDRGTCALSAISVTMIQGNPTARHCGSPGTVSIEVAMSEMGLGCVKTPKSNLRVEISSRFRQVGNQERTRVLLGEDN